MVVFVVVTASKVIPWVHILHVSLHGCGETFINNGQLLIHAKQFVWESVQVASVVVFGVLVINWLLVSQFVPVYPNGHWHVGKLFAKTQTPPFKQLRLQTDWIDDDAALVVWVVIEPCINNIIAYKFSCKKILEFLTYTHKLFL